MGRNNSFLGVRRRRNPLIAKGVMLLGYILMSCLAALYLGEYSPAYAELVQDQVNAVEDGTSYGCGFPNPDGRSIYQTFVPDVYSLAAVDILLRQGGGDDTVFPPGGYNTTIIIRSGTWDGDLIGTATTLVPKISSGYKHLVRFEFSPAISLNLGETYVIQWVSPEGGGPILTWMGTQYDSYLNGIGLGCVDGLPLNPPDGEEADLYFITYYSSGPCADLGGDSDEDEICDDDDNCPEDSNADQSDIDRDGIGDVCDDDNDNDQVVDEIDNCRFVYNPKQEDFDGDGVGEACDNCPKASNVEQEDSDVDGVGDACENFLEDLEVTSDGPNFKPGEDLWLTATFVNNTPLPLQTILPDCFNTTFTVTDPEGNILAPRYRIRQAYAIPGDVVIIPPGPFRVTCNMAEMFDQTVLTSELDGSPIIYDVVATYANDHRDPDLDPVTGVCGDEPCVDLFVGAVSSTPQQVTIQGGPVERRTAECTFEPGVWAIEWASLNSPPISVQIKNIEGHPDVNDVNTATILLNGTVGIIDGSAKIADGVLTGQVERSLALQSLGTTVSGRVYPRVQGAFNTGDDVFYAQCGVDIVDAPVAIDIRPWLPPSFPNLIIRCSWGTLPVAIFSTEEFDATTVDPATVTLAEAAVKLKWNGEPMARVRDVNCDGYRDLVVRFKIKDLNLNPDDTTAYLEGMTFDGIPVVGSDSVKVVDYWRWRFWAH